MSHTFTEAKLEQAIISLLGEHHTTSGHPVYPHYVGSDVPRANEAEVLILDDLRHYLAEQYKADGITSGEIETILRQVQTLPASDLYQSNKTFCHWLGNGFHFKRADHTQKDLHIQLLDIEALPQKLAAMFVDGIHTIEADNNRYRLVNQLEIEGIDQQKRKPDAILYVNGLPLVVFEFKSAVREEAATTYNAWDQLHNRYRRDIPKLFVYNALCIISDGVNNKMGNVFSAYEFFYAWRKITGHESTEKEGINSLYTMLQGLFHPTRLLDVIKNFIFFPDTSKKEEKLCCRYPQYYAARKLYYNIKKERKEVDASGNNMGGSGKGGTYFGATGCGKSYTMQFLARLLMKSVDFESPTIVLITDRNDLDDQLSKQFCKATAYIGDDVIQPVSSRQDLRDKLAGRASGGVFLTTIHKFTEDIKLLTDRCNVVCISDEAHRSQINLDLKITIDQEKGTIKKSYNFV